MTTSSVGPSYYADFSGLDGLKKSARADDPNAIRQVARQFESLFTNMLLKSMREAKLGDGLGDSQETDFYQGMFDQQLALQLSQGKGLGLADMLVQQLTRAGVGHSAATGAATNTATDSASGATAVEGAGSAVPDAERQRFIQSIEPAAAQAASQLGVSTDSVIAQAALETGWGRHLPADAEGASTFNYFGVKTGTSWQGQSATATTTEFQQGAPAKLVQEFRRYDSPQQGIDDYVALLQSSSRYRQALGTGDDIAAFGRGLMRGGYATDPDYVQKLVNTAASVRTLRAGDGGNALKSDALRPTTPGGDTV